VIDRHPHVSIETVTCVIDDVIEHYDNQGNKGRPRQGRRDVADDSLRGLIHNEQAA
jgi:redox-sensitive bicupin YhaK (pirin superfamily)